MGTSVSNLQILGVPEETVRAALPRALVGKWSERFVTACLGPDFVETERKARSLSKKLQCTALAVSLIDGDTLRLMLYQNGKNLTYHIALPKYGTHKAGNSALFCSVLGLPEDLAPKLKRLFAGCTEQEEKLGILQALLGAPLFIHDSGETPGEAVKEDSGPLENWIRERPTPLKIKNQCKAELIQEIPERIPLPDYEVEIDKTILLDAVRADREEADDFGCKVGDIIGYGRNKELACLLPDGRLEITPLEQDSEVEEQLRQRLLACFPDPFPEIEALYDTFPSGSSVRILAGTVYVLENMGYKKDCLLHRYTSDLNPDGTVNIPYLSSLTLSLDGAMLYAIGFQSGLRVIDADTLAVIQRLDGRDYFRLPIMDGQNRLWVANGNSRFECYTPDAGLISRHCLKGYICGNYLNGAGQVCVITFQQKTYITRVYRFS